MIDFIMQNYDILMLVVLAGATIFGAVKGLAWQLAALGSLVASYFLALHFSPGLAQSIGAQAPWNRFAAMAIIYVGSGAVIWYFFHLVSKFVDRLRLRDFDRQLGAMFGLATAVVACVVLTFFAVTLSETARAAVLSSRSGYYTSVLLDKAQGVMPPELHEVLDPYVNRLEKELKSAQPPAPIMSPSAAPPASAPAEPAQSVYDRSGYGAPAALAQPIAPR